MFVEELLEDTMMEPEPFGNAALSGDEEFCMVEDIVGVGITVSDSRQSTREQWHKVNMLNFFLKSCF